MATIYGWAGNVLRVNMTTGSTSVESTKYTDEFIGGMGIGMRYMYDEVPISTKPYDLESKLIISVGPLTGSSVPCSGRTNVNHLSTFTKDNCIVDGHMGGHFGNQLKYSGFDAIIIEGQSATPKYLVINDDNVELRDASAMWGQGTRKTDALVAEALGEGGDEYIIASIGQAGENLVNCSCIVNGCGHVAGAGAGAVLGSKKLKAIAVKGTGSVKISDMAELQRLTKYQLEHLIGANNNHNVPSVAQSWAEYTSTTKNRWQGGPGRTWGQAEGGPVDTGEQPSGDINRIGYRALKGVFDTGEYATKYIVKQAGCASCPIRCYPEYKIEKLAEYDLPIYATNTCVSYGGTGYYVNGTKDFVDEDDAKLFIGGAYSYAMDDFGYWDNYGMGAREFTYLYKNGILEKVLPKEEYDSINWQWMEDGDPRFVVDILRRYSMKEGELSKIGSGCYYFAQEWNLGDEFWDDYTLQAWGKMGFPKHHSIEDAWQSGAISQLGYNRDCMVHCLTNFVRSGSPFEIIKKNVEAIFGEGAVDAPKFYTPVNEPKVKLGKWSILEKNLHDSLTLCNWVWPMTLSSDPERKYVGDLDLESDFLKAVTGKDYNYDKLLFDAERIAQLQRGYTTLQMNTKNMRVDHDFDPAWIFDDEVAFTEGTDKLQKADWQKTKDMFYEMMGWDVATGIPTRETLEKFNMKFLADDLEAAGLLPA